jgi:hypothetical protein
MTLRKMMLATLGAAAASAPLVASADSDLGIGGTGTTASASLDFLITIPDFVYFQVGTIGSVDRVDFDLSAGGGTEPGSGGPFLANGGVLDGADGALTVVLTTNVSSVNIAATGGNLDSGGDTLPFDDITAADGGNVTVPDFGTNVDIVSGLPGTLNDTWTYTYDNSSVYAPGTYTGQVTYTATTL